MAYTFNVTYEIVTEESAEHGEAAEQGFAAEAVSLGEAVRAAETSPGGYTDCGRWFVTEPDQDYRTGEYTSYAIHPPSSITPASYARLSRVLTGR
jgi:hypothetical protein